MNKSFPKKIFLTILFLNVVALAAYTFLFLEIKKKNEFALSSLGDIKSQTTKEKKFEAVLDNLANTEGERNKLDTFFIQNNSFGVVQFIEKIEYLAKYSNLSLDVKSILFSNQNLDEKNNASLIENMKLNLDVNGSYSDIVYFLKFLELLPYKLYIDRVSIEKKEIEVMEEGLAPLDSWDGKFDLTILKLKS